MSEPIVYFRSGRGRHVHDTCHRCGTQDFRGEIIMGYDRQSGEVHLICEACFGRLRQDALTQQVAGEIENARRLASPCDGC